MSQTVLVSGHGGNYVLGNVVQAANVGSGAWLSSPIGTTGPTPERPAVVTDNHEDMRGGELETSILLHVAPELVRAGFEEDDFIAPDRTHLHITEVASYSASGLIGRPSLADAEKGRFGPGGSRVVGGGSSRHARRKSLIWGQPYKQTANCL